MCLLSMGEQNLERANVYRERSRDTDDVIPSHFLVQIHPFGKSECRAGLIGRGTYFCLLICRLVGAGLD